MFIAMDHPEMGEVAYQVTKALGEIDEILTDLDRTGEDLATRWNGLASDAFASAHRQWAGEMRDLRRIAHSMQTLVGDHSTAVDAHDRRRAGVWAV
jgi:WXG100 family type VII secretion target